MNKETVGLKRLTGKVIIALVAVGFVGVGISLLTNHWGMAIRITSYLYFFLFGLVIYEKVS